MPSPKSHNIAATARLRRIEEIRTGEQKKAGVTPAFSVEDRDSNDQ
jgi:hypothetical protein